MPLVFTKKEWEWGNLQQESSELLRENVIFTDFAGNHLRFIQMQVVNDKEQYCIKNNQESKRLLRMLVEV